MCFDVPKVVRSPGYDHGYNKESRNGRDIKIDILDDYIRTPEVFRGSPDNYRSTGGLPEPPRESNGPMWAIGERESAAHKGWRVPPMGSPNWTRGAAPFSFSFSSSFLLSYSNKERRSPTPGGSRTPPWRALLLGRLPPP